MHLPPATFYIDMLCFTRVATKKVGSIYRSISVCESFVCSPQPPPKQQRLAKKQTDDGKMKGERSAILQENMGCRSSYMYYYILFRAQRVTGTFSRVERSKLLALSICYHNVYSGFVLLLFTCVPLQNVLGKIFFKQYLFPCPLQLPFELVRIWWQSLFMLIKPKKHACTANVNCRNQETVRFLLIRMFCLCKNIIFNNSGVYPAFNKLVFHL